MPARSSAGRDVAGGLSGFVLCACAVACGGWAPGTCVAQEADSAPSLAEGDQTLFLDASINGIPKGMIIEMQLSNGRLYALPEDLAAIGVDAGGVPPDPRGQIALDDIPELRYAYSPEMQTIDLQVAIRSSVAEELGYELPVAARRAGRDRPRRELSRQPAAQLHRVHRQSAHC